MIKWQEVFSKDGLPWQDSTQLSSSITVSDLNSLKSLLDAVHIRLCLVKPYQENKNYPLVEARELLPSFDNDMFEYKELPGFAMVAFARQLDYFSEIFQFDRLHPVITEGDGACCPRGLKVRRRRSDDAVDVDQRPRPAEEARQVIDHVGHVPIDRMI